MVSPVILQKEDKLLPDYYIITINYLTGRKDKLKVTDVNYVEKLVDAKGDFVSQNYNTYRIWTHENLFKEVPRSSVESIDYDENYTKIIELHKIKKEA